jgi:hypothetical protein
MAKIEATKKGRADGGYTRLFSNKELGSLFSQIHATVIRAGDELEKLLVDKHLAIMTEQEAIAFISGGNSMDLRKRYIITKPIIRKYLKAYIGCHKEPDYVILNIPEKKCYVVELKDGDTFDTKKSFGEIATLKEFAAKFKDKFPGYEVFIKVCSFNLQDKTKITMGLKNQITLEEAMTGEEFCTLISILYSNIITQRENEGPENITYFLKELLNIEVIKEKIISLLR